MWEFSTFVIREIKKITSGDGTRREKGTILRNNEQAVASDLMAFVGKEYLVVVDYFNQ